MNNNTTRKAVFWSFLERFSSQVVTFLIGIVLARLLTPSDYGIVGLMSIFLMLSNVFIDSGFGNALIRKKSITNKDYSTAFIFNIIVGLIVYIVLCTFSSIIADYFNEPILTILIKLAGINVILNSLCIIPVSILTSRLNIKCQTIINISSQIPGGIIAIIMAYKGFGVYSLVFQTIIASFIKTILLWFYVRWKPIFIFNFGSFRYLWSFGSKLLFANIIGTIFNEVYSVIIGKYIGKNDLGYYSKSSQLNNSISNINTGIIQKVSLPILARYQEDRILLKQQFCKMMEALVLVTAPISAYLCFVSDDIIILLWTDKWLRSAVLFKLLVVGSVWLPISTLSLILLQVVNRTDIILKLEIPKKIIFASIIMFSFFYGIKGLVIGQVVINVVASFVNMYPTKKILNYNYLSQAIDIMKYFIVAYSLGFILYYLMNLNYIPVINCLLFGLIYVMFYIVILVVIKDRIIHDLIRKYYEKIRLF